MGLSIRRSKPEPKTLTDRVRSFFADQRNRAFALAGAAAGVAGALALWRSRRDDRPPTHTDPARSATGPAVPAANPAVKPPAEGAAPAPSDEPAKTGTTG